MMMMMMMTQYRSIGVDFSSVATKSRLWLWCSVDTGQAMTLVYVARDVQQTWVAWVSPVLYCMI